MTTHASNLNTFGFSPGVDERERLERGHLITATRHEPRGVDVQVIMACSPERIFGLLTDYSRLPEHIYGLQRADLLHEHAGVASVRFTMKLPFPIGQIVWTNRISMHREDGVHRIEWKLIDGDLRLNQGQLLMSNYGGDRKRTYACYHVEVESKTRLPKSAERLATRWLVPTIVSKLRSIAEKE